MDKLYDTTIRRKGFPFDLEKLVSNPQLPQIWFTADTHFYHQAIIKHCWRGFNGVDQMNETIIRKWNMRVRPKDLVYHLGDVSLGKPKEVSKLLDKLNGHIYLIKGNHDSVASNKLCRDRFEWIKPYKSIKPLLESGIKQQIILCHYAFRVWDRSHHGSWNLFGHSHGNLKDTGEKSLDVGVDNWNFWPVHLEEIALEMSHRKFEKKDHHSPPAIEI